MTDPTSLSEKKKKLKAKEKKEVCRLEIKAMDDNTIEVFGPIGDMSLVMRMVSGALEVIADYNNSPEKLNLDIEANRKEKEESRIITPGSKFIN